MKLSTSCALALLVAASGCDAADWGPEVLAEGRSSAEVNQLKKGRAVYADYCAGCHGEQGDGQGPAARFLNPSPRDFRTGRVKFALVPSGEAPRDEDYMRILGHGLSGTAMPEFRLLSERERTAVIAYIRLFDEGDEPGESGAAVALGQDPWRDDRETAVAEGEKIYHTLAKCWSCHPSYVRLDRIKELHAEAGMTFAGARDNLFTYEMTDSQWNGGEKLRAPDFLAHKVKTGFRVESLVRVIGAGVGGTAMPTWAGSIDADEIWALAYYVNSLALMRGTREAAALKASLSKPEEK